MCITCQGDLIPSITNYVVSLKDTIIIVKGVPCEECQQCGETYFSNDVVLHLDEIVKNVLSTFSTEIAVVNYPNKVA